MVFFIIPGLLQCLPARAIADISRNVPQNASINTLRQASTRAISNFGQHHPFIAVDDV